MSTLPLTDRGIKYLTEVMNLPKDGADRLIFFQQYLEDADEMLAREYQALTRISIDYAVMEKAREVLVVQAPFRWDDVGSWLALERMQPQDAQHNTVLANHAGIDTERCVIVGDAERLIATAGVRDLINLFQLNQITRSNTTDALDRRVELRTMAYLQAHDFRERLSRIWQRPQSDTLRDRVLKLALVAARATGHWGVWLSVFSGVTEFGSRLATEMPGTSPGVWVL